jgi:glycerol-3-phosphate acyltransferase PlsY
MIRLGLVVVMSYIVGSIPFGFLVGRARGVDLRKVGSGNIGSTNIYRALGLKTALGVFALDAGKGLVATRVLSLAGAGAWDVVYVRLVAALAVILGSVASIFMGFRGGKGVATGAGAFLGLEPLAATLAIAIWTGLVAAFKIVSVGSLAAAAALPVLIIVLNRSQGLSNPTLYLALGVVGLVFVSHRSNVRRLLRGTEKRIGRSGTSEPGAGSTREPGEEQP